jgi:hypothetical protein
MKANGIIKISFKPEMAQLIYEGNKTCTSRNKCCGKVGDIFKIKDKSFKITEILDFDLDTVAYFFFNYEGFENSKQFIEYWNKLYPKEMFHPNKSVIVHFFEEVK